MCKLMQKERKSSTLEAAKSILENSEYSVIYTVIKHGFVLASTLDLIVNGSLIHRNKAH